MAGLIAIKTLIITAIGPRVGLSIKESVRIGFLLSQGGEFAFVVFSLANRLVLVYVGVFPLCCKFLGHLMLTDFISYGRNRLGVLPLELNKLLIIVVVLSMALTPLLNEVGRRAADFVDTKFDVEDVSICMLTSKSI